MPKTRKTYVTPAITEVKFEDKNLVTFGFCQKATKISEDSFSCCNLNPGRNQAEFDPS